MSWGLRPMTRVGGQYFIDRWGDNKSYQYYSPKYLWTLKKSNPASGVFRHNRDPVERKGQPRFGLPFSLNAEQEGPRLWEIVTETGPDHVIDALGANADAVYCSA